MTFSMNYYDIYDFTFFISIFDYQNVHGMVFVVPVSIWIEQRIKPDRNYLVDVTQTNAITNYLLTICMYSRNKLATLFGPKQIEF